MLLVIMLAGCGSSFSMETAYKKITPQEAQIMMSDDVIILDVRTQEEYDSGHIKNAILLPDHEIKEKTGSIIADKSQTVLVYCRTGIRSEAAAKELIRMGYTNVFDFGGIVDWTGEIVWDVSDTIFYNYFGGELPPDIISPIDYKISKKINDQMSEFTFNIIGINEERYGIIHNSDRYCITSSVRKIEKITIKDNNGMVIQEITDLHTENSAREEDMYEFSFDDWNFDGFLDFSLWKSPGGTMHNEPAYYWLWDNNLGKFVENEKLEDISSYSSIRRNIEENKIESYTRLGPNEYGTGYYECREDDFVMVKHKYVKFELLPEKENEHVTHIVISELINGQMAVTKDYYEDGWN